MASAAYISALQTLLHDQAGLAYLQSTLLGFINEARQEVALESQAIVGVGTMATAPNVTFYQNSGVTAPTLPQGIASLITPNAIQYSPGIVLPSGGSPQIPLQKRNWQWFNFYELGIAARPPGPPRVWAPFTQGAGNLPQGGTSAGPTASGSFRINLPNAIYTLFVDGVWSPINLVTDTDPEAIPSPWTDAVPLYALYLGFMDARLNTLARQAFETYELWMTRARGIVTPLPAQQAFPGGLAGRRAPGQAPPQRGAGAGPSTPAGPQGQGGGGA